MASEAAFLPLYKVQGGVCALVTAVLFLLEGSGQGRAVCLVHMI